ncbi:MAG: VCBS repeat-containing protein, partial [Candidatus Hydrogenedentes bacterium]|nr:VCBS repeat-containing protein [Candidatus Hydrogenedentota bacterium]
LYTNEGSGEDSCIADVDNDGKVEYLTADCYREDAAKVLIFEFDDAGELEIPPRVVIEGYDKPAFNCSLETGDVDNDGANELVVMWKGKTDENHGTLLAYDIGQNGARVAYTFAYEDPDLDLGYAEKMMCIADADNDGLNDLVVTTRGEPPWNGNGLGHVLLFTAKAPDVTTKEIIADFQPGTADALWPAVGDADNDGKNEIVVATGVGNREEPGTSHVVIIEKIETTGGFGGGGFGGGGSYGGFKRPE